MALKLTAKKNLKFIIFLTYIYERKLKIEILLKKNNNMV